MAPLMKITAPASKMNLDIILRRRIILDRECLFAHNFPDVEYRKYFEGFLELTCKNVNRLMKNVNKILDYAELRMTVESILS